MHRHVQIQSVADEIKADDCGTSQSAAELSVHKPAGVQNYNPVGGLNDSTHNCQHHILANLYSVAGLQVTDLTVAFLNAQPYGASVGSIASGSMATGVCSRPGCA